MNENTLELTFQLGAPGKCEAICGEVEVFQVLWQDAVVLLKDIEARIFSLLTKIFLIVVVLFFLLLLFITYLLP